MTGRHLPVLALLALGAVACSDPTAPRRAVTLRFCSDEKAVAVQNEGESWQRVGSGRSVTFKATAKIGLAVAEPAGSRTSVFIFFLTADQAEKTFNCPSPGGDPGNKTVHASVAGLGTYEYASLASPGQAMLNVPDSFDLCCLAPEPIDLVAWKQYSPPGTMLPTVRRMIVRRAQNPAHGAVLDVFDFNSAESFDFTTSTLTFVGAPAGATISTQTDFHTATGTVATTSVGSTTGVTITDHSVPESHLVAGDLHSVLAAVDTRNLVLFYRTPGDRTITFGALLSPPTFSNVGTQALPRLRVEIRSQPDYPAQVGVSISAPDGHAVAMDASREFFDGTPVVWSLTVPDLSHIPEFGSAWAVSGSYLWGAHASAQPWGWTTTDAKAGDVFGTAFVAGSSP